MDLDDIFKEFIEHRVSFKEKARDNGFDWADPLSHEKKTNLKNDYNLGLVLGSPNSHCEFLSWVINCSSSFEGHLFSYILDPISNINFGTFYTFSPLISTVELNYEFSKKLVSGYYHTDDMTVTKEKFDEFLSDWKSITQPILDEGRGNPSISVPLVCNNIDEVANWVDDCNLHAYIPYADLPNSHIRSHYIHMNMKDEGVKEYTLQDFCKFLVDFVNNEQVRIDRSCINYVNMSKVFGLDKQHLETTYNHIGASRPNWGNLMEKIHDYEFTNFPQHKLLHTVNSMNWKDIEEISVEK